MKFSDLELHPKLRENLENINFEECTPIQEQAIPTVLKQKDLAGLAQTGTGKTGAFLIPLIERILRSKEDPSHSRAFTEWKHRNCILVLVPTRELAEQVTENAEGLLPNSGLSVVSIYGGTGYEKQKKALENGVELVVATPGRLIDLYKDHSFDPGQVRAVVFDEADRMFDMGFKDDMKFILRRLPKDRQFLVFSATLNFDVLNVAYEFGAEPVEINISRDQPKAENVKDHIYHLGQEDKPGQLLSLIKKYEPRQAIIFSNFKRNVERIAKFLNKNGYPAVGISSLLTQGQRNRVMEQFKAENDRNILVATDLAARGLDILGVDLVFNYELPDDPENYVHRIGRTGRAGKEGTAMSLVSDRDVDALARIESFLNTKLETAWLDDGELVKEFEPFPRDFEGGGSSKPRRFESRSGGPGRSRGGDRRSRPQGGRRPPRRDGQGPESSAEHRASGGEQRSGSGGSTHRDRQSGRHKNSGSGSQRPQGQKRADHRRPHGKSNPSRRPSSANGQPRSQRPHVNGNGKSHAPNRAAAAANAGLGQKVGGFLKRLFGRPAEEAPAKSKGSRPSKSSTRNS